jgi:chromosome segregation ATPase
MKYWETALAILVALFASIALADDFKTLDGKEHQNVTVTNQDPCTITVSDKKAGRILRFYFTELRKDVQERFHYDADKCKEHLAAQNAESEEARRWQETLRRKYEDKNKKEWEGEQWQKWINDLRDRHQSLQQQEDDLARRIAELEALPEFLKQQLGYRHWNTYPNPARKDLPSLESRLKEVRRDKEQVRQKLEDAGQSPPGG